jgi:hypothetical protein
MSIDKDIRGDKMKVEIKITAEVAVGSRLENGYTRESIIKEVSRQVTFVDYSPVTDFVVDYIKEVK